MKEKVRIRRRDFLKRTGELAMAGFIGTLGGIPSATGLLTNDESPRKKGEQRLSISKLKKWEKWEYGMFIHWGMPTYFDGTYGRNEYKLTRDQTISAYNPDMLDVDQWVSVARDAGMKYVVLTAKHGYSFSLWPSKHSDHTVAYSSCKTDVVEKLVLACRKKGIKAGLYYPATKNETLMTSQLTELLTQYGEIDEIWIDTAYSMRTEYRTFLYNYIVDLQPQTYIMMNRGMNLNLNKASDYDRFMPSDLISIEKGMPSEQGYQKWHSINDKDFYIPGEVCDPIGKNWFYLPSDPPRTDLIEQYHTCRERGVNLLLNVPPDKHGLIREEYIQALTSLRRNARI